MTYSSVVRGSVNQIHIEGVAPATSVLVTGPGGLRLESVTDDCGALVLRNVPAGNGYEVDTGDGIKRVDVLEASDHPSASFYQAQTLADTAGYVTTRDGTQLSYRVRLPNPVVHGDGPYPAVITYSGYQPSLETPDEWQDRPFVEFNAAGYAVIGVNMRGTGCSGGAFDLMEPLVGLDGYDVVEAFAAQRWVDGVALGDQSWPGISQLLVASTQPPSLSAIVAGAVICDWYRDIFYPGGIENVGFARMWANGREAENATPSSSHSINERVAHDATCRQNQGLRSQSVSIIDTIRSERYDGPYWQARAPECLVGRIRIPTMLIVSWQDIQTSGRGANLLRHFSDDVPLRFIGINGFHSYYAGPLYPASEDVWREILRFLATYLGGGSDVEVETYESEDPVMVFLEKDVAGHSRAHFTLPSLDAAGDGTRLRLGSDLPSNRPAADGRSSTFTYDPSAYRGFSGMEVVEWGPSLQDEVSFTTPVLNEQLVMAGSASADLWVSAEATDVDLQVTITEVRPDGNEMLVQSGWLRASHRALDEDASTPLWPRHRHTAESCRQLDPGDASLVRVEVTPFAHAFRAGSRVRVTVGGPGGGGNFWPWEFDSLPGSFDVTILHRDDETSCVVLPIVEPRELQLSSELPECGALDWQPCRTVNERRRAP